MSPSSYQPLFELTRGEIVESIHFGAIAVSDNTGRLVAWAGDPQTVTYLRSTAKPFQALPFIERGGIEFFNLEPAEVALICASHSGTDAHVSTVRSIQAKTGIKEEDLLCGVHPAYDPDTEEAMRQRGEQPTPNRHNCSGKHTGMLAFARMQNWPLEDYIQMSHPVQQHILSTLAEMCGIEPGQVEIGVDGCSAPNFAVSLQSAAQAYARLADPVGLEAGRQSACRAITQAMARRPDMVAGPARFDTQLMEAMNGRVVSKGGAEGYRGMALLPGAIGPGSPALGIALKISDGDARGRAVPAVSLEILRQLGALAPSELDSLSRFGPCFPVLNWREIHAGVARPSFQLQFPD